jgi:hypothetical protein
MFEMQGATSIYTELSVQDQKMIAGITWRFLQSKDHKITKLWEVK